jgi:hypothetical protein
VLFNNLFIFLIKFSPFRDYLPMKSPLSARATFFVPFFRSCCRKMISLYLLLRIELLLIALEFLDLIQTVSIKIFLKSKIRFTPTVLRRVLFSFNFSSIHWLSVLCELKRVEATKDERILPLRHSFETSSKKLFFSCHCVTHTCDLKCGRDTGNLVIYISAKTNSLKGKTHILNNEDTIRQHEIFLFSEKTRHNGKKSRRQMSSKDELKREI